MDGLHKDYIMKLRTQNKRIPTKENGIFFKEIVDEKNKVVDKVFLIRYRVDDKDKLITIGKYSQGIRINYCKKKRDEILHNIRLGEMPTTIKAKRVKRDVITFDMLAQNYFEYAKLHNRDYKATISRYDMHIKPYLGNKEAQYIKLEDVEQIQKDKLKKLAPKTLNHLIQGIKTIYNFSIERNFYIGINPVQKVKRIQTDNAREKFLSLKEIKLLEDELKDNEQLYLFVKLALCTGGRINTIRNIKKKDVNIDNQVISLTDFKNGTSYKGFIPDNIIELLTSRLDEIESDDEVLNYDNTKNLLAQLGKRMRPILNILFNQGLALDDRKNRTVIHTLRHTFASHLAINGTPIYTIQKLINHKDITMTMRYAKLAPDSGKEFVNELYK